MVNFPKKIINDAVFEQEYFYPNVEKIKNWDEFIRLQRLASQLGYIEKFEYSKDQFGREINYYIDFGIYDRDNILVSVPKDSNFYDVLNNLCTSGCVVTYYTGKKKTRKWLYDTEMQKDFVEIISYLESLLNNH